MSFRKLAKDVFDAARERHRRRESQENVSAQQFPGQQYHGASQAPPTQHYPIMQAPSAYSPQQYSLQAPNYPSQQWGYGVGPQAHYHQNFPGQQAPYPVPQSQSPGYTSSPAPRPDHGGSNIAIDIFTPLETSLTIPITQCDDHPVPRHCILTRHGKPHEVYCHLSASVPSIPLQTNAFYANLLLGGQTCSVWTHPYSVSWAKGGGNAHSRGLAISQVDREQLAFGPPTSTGASQYYINPVGIQSIILSATELGESTTLTTDSLQAFSVNVNLSPNAGATPVITFPLLQGIGFVTGIFKNCTPLVQTSVFFRELQPAGLLNNGFTAKYRIILEDGKIWLLYVTSQSRSGDVSMIKTNNTTTEGPHNFTGIIQVAKLPVGSSEEFHDRSAGAYALTCTISARAYGNQGTYTFTFDKAGASNPLLMYALPHHIKSLTRTTAPNVTPLRLQTTTKGMSTGILADVWQMNEQLPIDMGFNPIKSISLSPLAKTAIVNAGRVEAEQDVSAQCCLDSMYFSGKGLGKFAMMVVALHDIVGERELANKVMEKLKQAFAVFVENKQRNPLVYEKGWRGVCSTAGMQDPGADFGNGYYNDHHFHYGYFVYAAAVIGYLDPSWLQQSNNVAWVNMLVRDFANPVNDAEFPFSRSFDWYHGHSWAKGLFESGDGKDEESTSEDSFASYALKMWGHTVQDANLEARGNLMLAIQAHVFQTYLLMEESNDVQPRQIIKNKVTGITFENKVDHATYFGMNLEYIQGIHMIPLNPCSALIRTPNFVREEWETYFSNGRVDRVSGGWRGILYANLALIDPQTAFRFFDQPGFDWGWLDGGASRTWCLAYCASLGRI